MWSYSSLSQQKHYSSWKHSKAMEKAFDEQDACDTPRVGCQVEEVFQLLSKAHMLDVLHLFLRRAEAPLRFKDVQQALSLSPNTLTERLKELTEAGLVTRTAYNEIPPRVDYEATVKAHDLRAVFETIAAWAERHDLRGTDAVEGDVQATV